MANKRLPMRKIKEVLRLRYVCGLSERGTKGVRVNAGWKVVLFGQ